MSQEFSPLVSIIPGGLAAVGCLAAAIVCLRRKRIIDDLPTSKTQGVFIGLSEIKGTAESASPLTGYLSGISCVYYSWQIEEHWSRTVTDTYRDSKGHVHTRTRTESGWKKIDGAAETIPFYLKDDTGLLQIRPGGAKIHGASSFNQVCGRNDPLYFGKGPSREIAHSTHKRRFQETAVPLHARLYVLGQAREREDMVAAEIAYDKNVPMFIISMQTERQISRSYACWFTAWFIIGLFIAAGSAAGWALLSGPGYTLEVRPFAVMIPVYLVVFVLSWLWTTYNNLINLHHQVERAWSQIDIQLKRRNDLIKNLIGVIQGFKQYESATLLLVAEIRQQLSSSALMGQEEQPRGLAPLLYMLAESYPEITAQASFMGLQQALIDTEQRIALARDYYNDVTTFYNTRLAVIPQRYIAFLARLHTENLFQTVEIERAPFKVDLAG
ncbi:MAG: LemA family protein [Dehalococcoidales bacterium]|nr:LemA family protein [Dehalococcoidales bacterium]